MTSCPKKIAKIHARTKKYIQIREWNSMRSKTNPNANWGINSFINAKLKQNTDDFKIPSEMVIAARYKLPTMWTLLNPLPVHNVLFRQCVFLPTKPHETYLKIYIMIYHSTYICPSLFGWKENLIFKDTEVSSSKFGISGSFWPILNVPKTMFLVPEYEKRNKPKKYCFPMRKCLRL